MGDALNLVIEPFPPERGRKKILVDGVLYGVIHMTQHGSLGNSFWFQQAGIPGCVATCAGDKLVRRQSRCNQVPLSVEQRLRQTAETLVAQGVLVSIARAEAKAKSENDDRRRVQEEQDRREQEALRSEARKQLSTAPEALIDVVVGLMKWAQTR